MLLKHQQNFRASLEQLAGGDHLFRDLDLQLGQYAAAERYLASMESGQTDLVPEIIGTYRSELDQSVVSLESVQIHINSSQVQVIVDFLKKWIPIIISKIKEIAIKIFRWAREKLLRIDERLGKLIDDFKDWKDPQVTFTVGDEARDRVAFRMFNGNGGDRFSTPVSFGDMVRCLDDLTNILESDPSKLNIVDVLKVCYTAHHSLHVLLFADWEANYKEMNFASADRPGRALRAVAEELGSPMEQIRRASESMAKEASDYPPLKMSVSDVTSALRRLQSTQLKLVGDIKSSETKLDSLTRRLAKVQFPSDVEADDDKHAQFIRDVYLSTVFFINYAQGAMSTSLQFQLRSLGDICDMLERKVKSKK